MDPSRLTRRRFLASAGAAFLAACTRRATSRGTGAPPSVAPPLSPIPPGLNPTRDSKLRILFWDQYISKHAVDEFAAEHHATYDIATFNNVEDSFNKVMGGYDVFGVDMTDVPMLVASGDILPLNDAYLPHLRNLWPEAREAFGPLVPYAVPYGLNPLGVTFRDREVAADVEPGNVYDVFWDPRFAGRSAFVDNYRAVIAIGLLHGGADDVNTGDDVLLQGARSELLRSSASLDTDSPIALSWGRPSSSAQYGGGVLAPSEPTFAYPGRGAVIFADAMTVPASSKDPVLGHLFLDYLMRPDVAEANDSFTGVAQPVLGAQVMSNRGSSSPVPITESTFAAAHPVLPLSSDADRTWRAIWAEVRPVLAARST